MARDTQAATALPQVFGLQRNSLGEPRQLCVHRDTLALDGSGVGDTADLQLTMKMPENVVWQLWSFNAWLTGQVTTPEYILGEFDIYSTPIPGLPARQHKYTLSIQTYQQAIVVGEVPTNYIHLGGSENASGVPFNATAAGPGVTPFNSWVLGQGQSDPILFLGCGNTTNVDTDNSLIYELVWRGFYTEDLTTAALYS